MQKEELLQIYKTSFSYDKFLVSHAELVSTLEKLLWGITFFFPVRCENEIKVTAFNSALEIFGAYNDHVLLKFALLNKARKQEIPKSLANTVQKLSTFPASHVSISSALTVIEHTEVLAEILATIYDEKYSKLKNTKWIIIAIIELLKLYLRLRLLLINQGHILVHRKIPSRVVEEESPQQNKENDQIETRPTLLSYLRKIRHNLESSRYLGSDPTEADLYIITGELLWITRPVVYLFLLYLYGKTSWWPWIISLLFDISFSRCVANKKLNKAETAEINRRKLQFLLYLLKSPFYDMVSESPNFFKLKQTMEKIPLIGNLLPVVAEVLKLYNSRFFYTSGSK